MKFDRSRHTSHCSQSSTVLKPRFKPMLLLLGLMNANQLLAAPALEVAQRAPSVNSKPSVYQQAQDYAPRIQISILLDTSNSMDGLIDQARTQLWQIVDEFSKARRAGIRPVLQVAVYEYGNDRLASKQGYVRKVTGLTSDLDRVSEALFSLTTNGGSEFCGYAIDAAATQLQWSGSDQDIKAIFIAGNESFSQGPLPFAEAIATARSKGIKVNTIFAGNYQQGTRAGWQQGALVAGGDYMSIDHNQKIAHLVAPQDREIAELNSRLNQTYIPYGQQGAAALKRQQVQDSNSSSVSLGMLAERVKSKISAAYKATNWDLVDAVKEGEISLDNIEAEALPAPMVAMSAEEQVAFIEEKASERDDLKNQIADLNQQRDNWIAEQKAKTKKPEANTVSDALSEAIRKQGKEKHFEFN